jgi:hypothetical protein
MLPNVFAENLVSFLAVEGCGNQSNAVQEFFIIKRESGRSELSEIEKQWLTSENTAQ